MHKLSLTYRLLTPAWLGGPEQSTPEVRMQSLKGLLRWWYRAADPEFSLHESDVFGGIARGKGQSPVLLRPEPVDFKPWAWDEPLVRRFDEGHGRNMFNGIRYLCGPGVQAFKEVRRALPADLRFTVHMVWPRLASGELGGRQLRGAVSAAWLLGHLGGMGARGRRGWGSLSLERWKWEKGETDLAGLPLLCTSASVTEWYEGLGQAMRTFDRWFPKRRAQRKGTDTHPNTWGREFALVLRSRTYTGATAWAAAMDDSGKVFQRFRRRYQPDYDRVKAWLSRGGPPLAPHRASFGLPLSFRFSSVQGATAWAMASRDERIQADRHASILHVRVASLADGLHPLYLRLDGPAPGMGGPGGSVVHLDKRNVGSPEKDLTTLFLEHVQRGA